MSLSIRKIGLISRTYRHINRYTHILSVLIKYGFEGFVRELRITQYIEVGLQRLTGVETHKEVARLGWPERLRLVFEELGPTFVKLGQVLSTRPDLIPAAFADELQKLQEHVPSFPFAKARAIIEDDLGQPLDALFESFDQTPIAAASMAQVHRAVLKGGEVVAVKVQRPGIRQIIEVDLEILLHLANLFERHVDGGARLQPSRIVEEFSRIIAQELDCTIEASHLEHFAAQFVRDPTIYVPKVYREFSSVRVLTLEFVEGVRPHQLECLAQHGLDRKVIAARGADLILTQVFVHGFFHADPHPGNVLIMPDNVICYLDFGMMGRVDRQQREQIADLVGAVAMRDETHVVRAVLRITERDPDVEPDLRLLERDVATFMQLHLGDRLEDIRVDRLLHALIDLVNRHGLRMPADLVMMIKAMATVEGYGRMLDPNFDMITAAAPYVKRIKRERFHPQRIARDLYDTGVDLLELAQQIPGGFRDLLLMAKQGRLQIGFDHRGLDPFMESNERIANRVSFAIVVAALIVGSSLIIQSRLPPTWNDVPVIGLAGFVLAGVMGLWLLISIIRHGRM